MKHSCLVKLAMSAALLGFLALGLAPTAALAQGVDPATATFNVTATVVKNCIVSATALPFASYNGTALNVSSAVTVTCTNGTTYTVGLDQGKAAGATVTTRQMNITQPGTAGTGLNYNLLTTSYTGSNWGNTTGSWVSGTGTGLAQPLTVYGVLPGGQYLAPGSYTDTITATVTY